MLRASNVYTHELPARVSSFACTHTATRLKICIPFTYAVKNSHQEYMRGKIDVIKHNVHVVFA